MIVVMLVRHDETERGYSISKLLISLGWTPHDSGDAGQA